MGAGDGACIHVLYVPCAEGLRSVPGLIVCLTADLKSRDLELRHAQKLEELVLWIFGASCLVA